MLQELWQYCTTPVPSSARKLGHLQEAIALSARYRRCQPAWDAHYQVCREEITHAIEKSSCRKRALILGAGLLHDLPLKALARAFEQVVLIDLVFLREARRRAAQYKNVILQQQDVTGALEALLKGQHQPQRPCWDGETPVSLVVSLNLVTQLPLRPAQFLLKQGVAPERIDAYGRALIQAHLDYLNQFTGAQICLIADRHIEERRQGRVVDVIDPWWGVPSPKPQRQWWWQAVPAKEGRGLARWHQVGVNHWFNAAV